MKPTYDFSQGRKGPVIEPKGKTRITMLLDNDVLEAFRVDAAKQGKGYQTLINETLRHAIAPAYAPLTAELLRAVVREELALTKAIAPCTSGWKSPSAPGLVGVVGNVTIRPAIINTTEKIQYAN